MKLGVGTTDHEIPPPDRGTGDDVNTDLGDDVIVLNPSPPSSPTGAGTSANSNEQRQGGLFRNQVDLGGRLDTYSRSSSIAGRLERPGSRGGGSVMMADPSENQTQTLTIATSNINTNTNTNTNTNSSASAASTSSGSSLNRGGTHTTIGARLGYSIQHNPSPEISPRVNPGPGIDKYSSNSASGSNHTTAETVAALSKGLGSSDRVRVSYAGVGKGVGDNKTPRETQNNTRSDSNTTTAKKPPNAGRPTSKDGGGGQPPSKMLESLRVVQHQQQQQQQQQQQVQQQVQQVQQGESWTEARRSRAAAGAGLGGVGRGGRLLGVVNTATTTTSGSASASASASANSSSELDYGDERGLYSSVSAASAAGRVPSPVPIVSGVDSTVRTFSSVGSD